MPEINDRLSHALGDRYRIEHKLGEGGMATVYLAEDLRHHRKVALKVLKPELAAVIGADRFLVEIENTARLQHPNILPLFDSGEADGFLFYVMPFVEGESLRERLDRNHQLPVEEAVRLAIEVAEALHSAHEHGVVHRDIKPGNILVSQGRPLVADFGISLAVNAAGQGRLTETGLSLGTPHYMSPEQATGDRTVGPASDVYSLGCVLYEMLLGAPPHTGTTAQAILGKIITVEPESVASQRRAVPPNVDAVVAQALEKLPADRFASANDFAAALRDEGFRHGAARVGAASVRRRAAGLAGWAAAAVLGVLLLVSVLSPETAPVVRILSLAVPEGGGASESLAFTPDGSALVMANAPRGFPSSLEVRRLDDLVRSPVDGSGNAANPAVSPDGQTVAFANTHGLYVAPIDGRSARRLVEAPGLTFPRWGGDGHLYYSNAGRIHRVPAAGGDPQTVLQPEEGVLERFVSFQPIRGVDRAILAVDAQPDRIEMVDLESGRREVLTEGVRPFVTASGYLVFARAGGGLFAAPLDVESMRLTDSPVLFAEGVGMLPGGGDAMFALSESGDLAYWRPEGETSSPRRELVRVNRGGSATSVDTTWIANFESVEISPAGDRVAVTVGWAGVTNTEIWLKELDAGPARRLTSYQGMNRRPVWAPDEATLAFISDRSGRRSVYSIPTDGIGAPELLLEHPGEDVDEVVWAPEGDWLVYRTGTTLNARDIYARRLTPDTATIPVSARPGIDERAPVLSPDGRWLAYVSNETGQDEVWVRPFPDVGRGSRQISVNGGTEPVWSNESEELFFRSDQGLMSLDITRGQDFSTGEVRVLFPDPYVPFNLNRAYAFDGVRDRFLMVRNVSLEVARAELILVENFVEAIEDRLGR